MSRKNKEEEKFYKKAYYEANKEKLRAQQKKYKDANKIELKVKRDANKEKLKPYQQAWHKANYENKRAKQLKVVFNISTEEYDKILAFQNGTCAICLNPPQKKRLAVDHDHKTGTIRALLCYRCNTALGMFGDSPEILERAAYILRNPPAILALGEVRCGQKEQAKNE